MKLVLLLRLILALTLTFGLSSTHLLAQDDEEKAEEKVETQERGGGGQRGQGGGQRGGQPGGLPDLSGMTPEEQAAALGKYRQGKIIEMAEAVEVREDQLKEFVQVHKDFETALLKGQLSMRSVGRDRAKRQSLMQSITKANSTAIKAMKKILDKDQRKIYAKKMKERMPQQGQRGGGRGR